MPTPKNFEFLIYPKIVSGKCALENIPSELDGHDAQKPLIITSKRLAEQGSAAKLVKAFYDSTVVIGAIYDEVLEYAGISQARQAATLFAERGCDSIIALGNGPVADLAKAVNVLVSKKNDTLAPDNGNAVVSGPLKPFILVPAYNFSGWETTPTMMVDNRRISSEALFPETVIIDPRITVGGSSEDIAASGAIGLAQAFNALNQFPDNPMIDAIAHPAMGLLTRHLLNAVQNPRDKTACLAVANAAVMAGIAHANSGAPLNLLLAEALCAATGIPSGKLAAILLSATIATLERSNGAVRDELCLAVAGLDAFSVIPTEERSRSALELIMHLLAKTSRNRPSSLCALKIQPYLLDQVAGDVAAASQGCFSEAQCRSILHQAWENGNG